MSKIYVCKVWKSIQNLTITQTVDVENAPVKLLLISPDEKFLACVAGKAGDIYVFDILTGVQLHRFVSKESYFSNEILKSTYKELSAITSDNKLIVNQDRDMVLIDMKDGKKAELRSCKVYSMNVMSLHPSEKYVAVGTKDTTWTSDGGSEKPWKVFDVQSGEAVTTASHYCLANDGGVQLVKLFGQDNMFAGVALWGNSVIILAYLGTVAKPLEFAVPYRTLYGHSDTILQLALKLDESVLISASEDNRILVWDLHKIVSEFNESHGSKPDPAKIQEKFEDDLKKVSNTLQFAVSV